MTAIGEKPKEATFMGRLLEEKIQLKSKIERLTDFLQKEDAIQVAGEDQVALLFEQRDHMKEYLRVLEERIAKLEGN